RARLNAPHRTPRRQFHPGRCSRANQPAAQTRSRPASLARYSAASAAAIRVERSTAGGTSSATPTLTVIRRGTPPGATCAAGTAARSRSANAAAASAPGPSSSTANSSPPMRAATSSLLTGVLMLPAVGRSTTSPALGTRDLALEDLAEMAPVVQLGECVVGGELVDLLMVPGLDVAVADELEDALADHDVVAVGQHRLGHGLVVHARGIGGAEVADPERVALKPHPAMRARDAAVGNHQVRFVRAADQHRLLAQVHASPQPLAVDDDQAGTTPAAVAGSIAVDGALGGGELVGSGHVAGGFLEGRVYPVDGRR